MSEQNKAAMRRFYDTAVNEGNVDLIDEMLSEDFAEHEEFPGDRPLGRDRRPLAPAAARSRSGPRRGTRRVAR